MISNGFPVDNETIKLPKLGRVKIVNHRHKTGIAKSCTISMTPTNEFYISILWKEDEMDEILPKVEKEIGIDLGLTDLAICSDGTKFPILKSLRNNLSKIKKEQRKLSKMTKGSNNYNRQKLKVAKLHQHIANQRKDYLHKISYKITNENQVISLEDLNVKGMMKNRHLSKATASQKFYEFRTRLQGKCAEKGIELRIADRWYPSSRRCHNCGQIRKDLKLSNRVYQCSCGYCEDRDLNAALNLRDVKTYQSA